MITAAPMVTAMLALALALSVPLRAGRAGGLPLDYATFAGIVSITYLALFLQGQGGGVFVVATLMGSALVGPAQYGFLRHLLGGDPKSLRSRWLWLGAVALIAVDLVVLGRWPGFRWANGLYLVGCLVLSLRVLLQAYGAAPSEVEQQRIRDLLGLTVPVMVLIVVELLTREGNLLLGPGAVLLPPLGTLGVAAWLAFLSEAVVLGRLLDGREMAGRAGVFGLLVILLAGIFPLVVLGPARGRRPAELFIDTLLAAALILILHQPLQMALTRFLRPHIARRTQALRRVLTRLDQTLPALVEAEPIVQEALTSLRSSGHLEQVVFFLRSVDEGEECFSALGWLEGEAGASFPKSLALEPLASALGALPSPMDRELLERQDEESARAMLSVMDALGVNAAMPLRRETVVHGFLGLLRESASPPWSATERSLLVRLADRVAAALDNTKAMDTVRERARLATLGRLASALAHEVRNPLGSIKGAAQVLETTVDPETHSEFLSIIISESERLDDVVSQFLDYARPLRPDIGAVSLERWAEQLFSQIRAGGLAPELSLTTHAPEAETVRVDGARLRQVALNLVRNANEAIQESGSPDGTPVEHTITVGVRSVHRGASPLPPGPRGWRINKGSLPGSVERWVELWVDDDGPGISAGLRDDLFVPFYTTKARGTGLGLPACERLVRRMEGALELTSGPGLGTRVIVRVPDVPREPTG